MSDEKIDDAPEVEKPKRAPSKKKHDADQDAPAAPDAPGTEPLPYSGPSLAEIVGAEVEVGQQITSAPAAFSAVGFADGTQVEVNESGIVTKVTR